MRVSIASGKGGTGKTTIATSIAHLAANYNKTLLFDIDVEEPNCGIFLKKELTATQKLYKLIPKINPIQCSFCGMCEKVCAFNAILKLKNDFIIYDNLCHSCNACMGLCPQNAITMIKSKVGIMNTYHDTSNLTFIETIMDIGIEQGAALIKQSIEHSLQICDQFDYAFYDAPPGTSCSAIAATKGFDFVILVAEPTLFGLNDMKLAVDMLRHNHQPFAVVINKISDSSKIIDDFCLAEDIKVIERLEWNRTVATEYSKGEMNAATDSVFSAKIRNIFEYLRELPK